MKKSILNLGKALNKAEQKLINGGNPPKKRRQDEMCENITGMTYEECQCTYYGVNCPTP